MTTLSLQRQQALRHLLKCSALADHTYINKVVDQDVLQVDMAAIDQFGWSSGEEVLIGIIKAIAGFNSEVKITDLWKLDSINREVATKAIEMALTGHGLGADLN